MSLASLTTLNLVLAVVIEAHNSSVGIFNELIIDLKLPVTCFLSFDNSLYFMTTTSVT